MRILAGGLRVIGIALGLLTAAVGVDPTTDDAGHWTTNPFVSGAIACGGLVLAAALAARLRRDPLALLAGVLVLSVPFAWFAHFVGTYDWFTTDGGTCTSGPCGTLPEVAEGLFAAYGLLVAGVCGAVLGRGLRRRTYDAPDGP